MKKITLLFTTLLITFVSFGQVPQEQYDKLKNENAELKAELNKPSPLLRFLPL